LTKHQLALFKQGNPPDQRSIGNVPIQPDCRNIQLSPLCLGDLKFQQDFPAGFVKRQAFEMRLADQLRLELMPRLAQQFGFARLMD
jgi:hypothetical protein